MSKRTAHDESARDEFDPEVDVAFDANGTRISADYLDILTASLEAAPPVRRGRPRLGESAGHSPRLETRVPATVHAAVVEAAAAEGITPSAWLREAVADRLARVGS